MATQNKGWSKHNWLNSGSISLMVLSLYFTPLVLFALAFTGYPEKMRMLLAFSSLIAVTGSVCFIVFIQSLIQQAKNGHVQTSQEPAASNQEIESLQSALHTLQNTFDQNEQLIENLKKSNEELENHLQTLVEESQNESANENLIASLRKQIDEASKQHQEALSNLQTKLQDKERLIEHSDHHIMQLKQELANTKFELDTVLKLELKSEKKELLPSLFQPKSNSITLPPLQTVPITPSSDQELVVLLEKTKELSATSKTPHQQLELPHFLDLSIDSLALEKRRLFDMIDQESELPAFVMNCQDAKMLFVSHAIKTKTGIPLDRFQKDFFSLVGHSKEHIKNALTLLKPSERTKIPIQLQVRPGEEIRAILALGVCPAPPFSRSAIGVIEPCFTAKSLYE